MRRSLILPLLVLLCATRSLIAVPPSDPEVADAAMRGDRAQVRRLLAAGADINVAQPDGMTALHWAAELGDAALAELLVGAGADLAVATRIGEYTPLHVAAELGHDSVVRILLAAGADPHVGRAPSGTTALHYAAAAGSAGAIEALLEHGADIDVKERNWGQTPLMFAASKGRLEAVRLLLARGADPSISTRVLEVARRATQDHALMKERVGEFAAFREEATDLHIWDPQQEAEQDRWRAVEDSDRTLVPVATFERVDWDSVQVAGRPLRYADLVGYQGGLTALLHAVREGHTAVALALLDGGASVNQVSAGDLTSPLLMAMINGHYDLGLALLERGADPTIASDAGTTPLYAVLNTQWAPQALYPQQQAYQQQTVTHLEVLEALLRAGANPNARLTKHLWYMEYSFNRLGVDTWGATPFWRAAYALDLMAMQLLVRYGADPSIPTKRPSGRTHYTDIPFSTREVAETEDQSGLPLIPPGGAGVYPIHAAAGFGGIGVARAESFQRYVPDGWLPAVRYLVEELGADIDARDFLGYTPLHHAAGRGHDDLVRYLVARGADPLAIARGGHTTVDMANGPVTEGAAPFPSTIEYLEGLGAKKSRPCVQC